MSLVLWHCRPPRPPTAGYFVITHARQLAPPGLVQGWAIQNAAEMLLERGQQNFFIDAGGDIAAYGQGPHAKPWRIGIRSPFNRAEIIKTLAISNRGVATSGTAIRGQHIYNPLTPAAPPDTVKSITVIGPNVYEADRFATAAFAMGRSGVGFIEQLADFEAYLVDIDGQATFTSGFNKYVAARS